MKRSTSFKFKQFEVHQAQCAMKVGTDGVLLGAWTRLQQDDLKILDIGAGTGLISLMIAQRNCNDPLPAHIDAVEIEPMAAEEALFNINNSPWSDRIELHECSFQQFAYQATLKQESYDLIVSNPPYFVDSSLSSHAARTVARHSALLPYDDLIRGVVDLLKISNGRFTAIFPAQEGGIFMAKAAASGLVCKKRLDIYALPDRPVKRIICEFELNHLEKSSDKIASPEISTLIINKGIDQGYTEDYIELTKEFYIRF